MTDLERLREEYAEAIADAVAHDPDPWSYELRLSRDLIAAIGDEIAELTGQNIDLEVWRASAVKRAEQAEADLQTIKALGAEEGRMSDFEAQCDCELDSPGVLSHLPVGERLKHWTDWALYLKRRIETHYRPRIAALEDEVERADAEIKRLNDICDRLAAAGRSHD